MHKQNSVSKNRINTASYLGDRLYCGLYDYFQMGKKVELKK